MSSFPAQGNYKSGVITLFIGASGSSNGATTNRFYPCFGGLITNTTESVVQATMPFALRVRRMAVKFNSNSYDGATVFSLRDDGADVIGTVLSIAAGSNAEVVSDPLDVIIAENSKICFRFDSSASNTGNWVLAHCFAICEVIL